MLHIVNEEQMPLNDTDRTRILQDVGAEIRDARVWGELSQQWVSDLMGWAGRDTASKLERGLLNITLVDYLALCRVFRDALPEGHPGVALAEHFHVRINP